MWHSPAGALESASYQAFNRHGDHSMKRLMAETAIRPGLPTSGGCMQPLMKGSAPGTGTGTGQVCSSDASTSERARSSPITATCRIVTDQRAPGSIVTGHDMSSALPW